MQPSENHQVFDIPIEKVFSDDTFNCRGPITPLSVKELAENIKKIGLQQPIVVQPYSVDSEYDYRVVCGHRRFAALKLNGSKIVPAIIQKGLSEIDARIHNLVENIQREDLDILQEAKAIEHLRLAGMSYKQVANRLKKSTGWVQVRFTLLQLPKAIQEDAAAGFITQSDIKDLFGLGSYEAMYAAVKQIKDSRATGGSLTVKKIKDKEKQKKQSRVTKRVRSVKEMNDMQDLVFEVFGNGLHTRLLAWSCGRITDYELMETMKLEADAMNIHWHIPLEVVEAHERSLNSGSEASGSESQAVENVGV